MSLDSFTQIAHYASLGLYGAALALLFVSWFGPRVASRAALFVTWAGLLVQSALLAVRWVEAGFLPVTGLFSSLHFLTLFVVGITLYFAARYRAAKLLPAALLIALLALAKAGTGKTALMPLTPALDTPLFFLHVATSFAAYGLFAVAAAISAHRMLGIRASEIGAERRMLDECLYIGYILFSWCMVAGSLWAFLAWGSYWTWRVKGLWSWLLWFYYSGVLHVRNRPRWQGRALDVLTIVGFALTLFTFLGLGVFLKEVSHPLE